VLLEFAIPPVPAVLVTIDFPPVPTLLLTPPLPVAWLLLAWLAPPLPPDHPGRVSSTARICTHAALATTAASPKPSTQRI
jgi:hypothetical protein